MNNISTFVQSQFPQFVQEDYPALIAFIEAYYKFLELEKNPQDILSNLIAYADIDRTLDEFVSKFEKQYLNGLPQQVKGDKRTFMKYVKDLYNTKGTEESFRLLFRLLFNEEIEIAYPKQQMLRLSDGKWSQRVSVKVILDGGVDTSNVLNKKIKIWTANGVINTYIKDFVYQSDGIYEVFIDKTFGINVAPGDRVTGLGFGATTVPTTSKMLVLNPGSGFHIGQVFDVSSVMGAGTKIKVTKVDANGGIKRAAFIQFGTGYEADFMVQFAASTRKSGALDPFQAYTNGFEENVLVTKVTYFASDYVEIDYSGQVVASSYTNDYKPDNAQAATTQPAVIQFYLGALCTYRGEYTTADGFLSDVNVIQDGYLYQDFSYVIKTKHMLSEFASVVKKLCHPAGTIMFGEVSLESNIDVGVSYEYFKVLAEQLRMEEFVTSTDAMTFSTGKTLTDALSGSTEALAKVVGKALTDTLAGSTESVAKSVGKALTDSLAGSTEALALLTGKALVDALSGSDDTNLSFVTGKVLADSLAGSIDSTSINTGKLFNSAITQLVTVSNPIQLGTGDGSTTLYQLVNELGVLNPIVSATVYQTNWQGAQPMFPTSRTNSFLSSGDFSNAAWGQTRILSFANTSAPDGTNGAQTITSNSSGTAYCYQSMNWVAGQQYPVSVFAKAGSTNVVSIQSFQQTGAASFTLLGAGSVTVSGVATGATITSLGNGWFYCQAIFTANVTGANNVSPCVIPAVSATASFYAPMSDYGQYIPTTTAAVTVQPDYTVSADGNTDITFAVAPAAGVVVSWTGSYNLIGDYGTSNDATYTFLTGKALADALAGSTETVKFLMGKSLTDATSGVADSIKFTTARSLTDSLSGSDDSGIALNTSRLLSDSLSGSDDSAISAYLFNYSDVTYFADSSYVGTSVM
jgi:hypothetical protein